MRLVIRSWVPIAALGLAGCFSTSSTSTSSTSGGAGTGSSSQGASTGASSAATSAVLPSSSRAGSSAASSGATSSQSAAPSSGGQGSSAGTGSSVAEASSTGVTSGASLGGTSVPAESGVSSSEGASSSGSPGTLVSAAAGGTVGLPSGARGQIPAGALSADTVITVERNANGPTLADASAYLGEAYSFGPSGTVFNVPVTLTLPYSSTLVPAGDTVVVLHRDDVTQQVTVLPALNLTATEVSAQTLGFSTFRPASVTPPSIPTFVPSTQLLPEFGGTVTFELRTVNAVGVVLAVDPPQGIQVPALTPTSNTVSVTLPANLTGDRKSYVFTLTATGRAGTVARQSATVEVERYNAPRFTKVAAGFAHWAALRDNGDVLMWGRNNNLQTSPYQTLANVVDLRASGDTTLVLLANGTVEQFGVLNVGTPVPADIAGVSAIALGESVGLAVINGTVRAWGFGQAMDVPAGLSGVVKVAAGNSHALALLSNGTVVGWGRNLYGEAQGFSALTDVVDIAAGRLSSLALRADGSVVYAGFTQGGMLAPPPPEQLSNVVAIGAYFWNHCLLKADGSVVSWRNNAFGSEVVVPPGDTNMRHNIIAAGLDFCIGISQSRTDLPFVRAANNALPLGASSLRNVRQVSVGPQAADTAEMENSHTLALLADGTVTGWANAGENGCGQVTIPADLGPDVVAVAAGGLHSLALKADGTVRGWGCGTQAVPPADLSGVTAIAAGGRHSLALKSNGTVVAWGDPDVAYRWSPTSAQFPAPPGGLENAVEISAGSENSLVLHADGTVSAFGVVFPGVVQSLPPLTNVRHISAGGINGIAVLNDGTVRTWGLTYRDEFQTIAASMTNIVQVAAGSSFRPADAERAPLSGSRWFALGTDGVLRGAGSTRFRQVDAGIGLRGVVQLSSGEATTAAVLFDGTVRQWGYMVVGSP